MGGNETWTVTRVDGLSSRDFHELFVKKRRPVVMSGMMKTWPALKWTPFSLGECAPDLMVNVKVGDVSEGRREMVRLSEYMKTVTDYVAGRIQARPPYLHDIPLFYQVPKLAEDTQPFLEEFLPRWYRPNWQNFVQFFMSLPEAITPLHFDTLTTHNLFFQVSGRKRWILIPE